MLSKNKIHTEISWRNFCARTLRLKWLSRLHAYIIHYKDTMDKLLLDHNYHYYYYYCYYITMTADNNLQRTTVRCTHELLSTCIVSLYTWNYRVPTLHLILWQLRIMLMITERFFQTANSIKGADLTAKYDWSDNFTL